MNKAERWAALHTEAMEAFDAIWLACREERLQSLSDRRFATIRGAQWEGQYAFGDEVDEDGRPLDLGRAKMEVPLFMLPIRRVQGEYRASRKTVDFRPKDEAAERANDLDGMYRADENESRSRGGGQLAYDNAFQEAIKGGFGAWRLRARFEDESDETNDHQRIGIEPIYDADQSVFFDIDAKDQQKSDARRGFVLFTLSRRAFESRYPNAGPATFNKETWTWQYDWTRPDSITLAEYYVVEDRSVLRRTFRQTILDGVEMPEGMEPAEETHDDKALMEIREDGGTLLADLEAQGFTEVRSRKIKRQRVRKFILSGAEVLEDEGYIAGERIPVVPLYAERSYVDGIERHQGMVRPVIDSTRINNVLVSNLTEAASDTSADTPIAAPEQMAGGLDAIWANRKVQRPGYLPLRPLYKEDGTILTAGLLGTLPPPQVAPNAAALLQLMPSFVAQLMGENEQPRTVPSNTSAAAIKMVNEAGDVATFLWEDNFSLALTTSGEIYEGMARELYVEEGRKMPVLDEEGKKGVAVLMEPRHGDDGEWRANDFANAKHEVVVDVGPATKTKRDATVEACLNIAQAATALAPVNPQAGEVAFAMMGTAIVNMDGEGIDGPKDYVRRMGVAGGWIEPTEEEAAEIEAAKAQQGQQVDPAVLAAQAQMVLAQAEASKAESQRIEAEARLVTAQANARKAEAETAAKLAEIPREDRAQILSEVKTDAEIDHKEQDQALNTVDTAMRVEQHDMGGANGVA